MEIVRLDPKIITFREINSFLASLLRSIPMETDPGNDEAARERLFSKPTSDLGPQGRELNEEWKQYVEPGLRHLFQTSNEVVAEDLKGMRKTGEIEGRDLYTLDIPVGHVEQWLNTLNQARLVMAARNAFTESELGEEYPPNIDSERDMHLLQIHFYASIQEILLHEME